MSKFSDALLGLILGNQVGNSPKEKSSPTHRYQVRQNKLIATAGLLMIVPAFAFIWWIASKSIPLALAFAYVGLASQIRYMIAASSDAVFDSLHERINLQSMWLEARLNAIELHLPENGKMFGTELWRSYGGEHALDLDEAYYRISENIGSPISLD